MGLQESHMRLKAGECYLASLRKPQRGIQMRSASLRIIEGILLMIRPIKEDHMVRVKSMISSQLIAYRQTLIRKIQGSKIKR
jgi:hypothetical protein